MADTQTYLGGDMANLGKHIAGQVQETSPFFAAAERRHTDRDGLLNVIAIEGDATLVPEGGRKPRLTIVNKEIAMPWVKVAFVTTFSEETLRNDPSFEDELVKAATGKLVDSINKYITGDLTPTGGVTFQSFDNVNTPEVEYGEDGLAAFNAGRKSITTLGGSVATDLVTSGDLYGAVAYSNNAQGVAPYDGKDNWSGVTPRVTKSLVTGGVLGDFTQAVYDIANDGVQISVSREATVTNTDGTATSLWEENKVGLRAEMYFRWGLLDERAFAKFVPAADAG